MLLELYADEHLLLPAMHFRWSYPEHATYMHYQFGKTSRPDLPYQQQLAVGRKVAGHFSGMLPALGIHKDSQAVIEAHFGWQLAVLQQHLQQLPYLLSSSNPCIADFGLMGPLHAHLYMDPVPGCLIKCTAPLVADYIERACSIATTSQPAGSDSIVSLQPQDPQRPEEGALQVVRKSQQQQQQQQQLAGVAAGSQRKATGYRDSSSSIIIIISSSSSFAESGFLSGDHVPRPLLPLLHNIFLEQMPIIISTLELLKQWAAQKQQQQQHAYPAQQTGHQRPADHHHQQQRRSKGLPQLHPPPGWLLLPRSLGMHSCQLFDPATGAVACTGSKASSAYVAWRAAEVVGWCKALDGAGKAAVQQLLQDISAAGAAAATGDVDSCCDSAGNGAEVAAGSGSTVSSGAEEKVTDALAGQPAASQSVAASVGVIDAAAAFAEVVRLVEQCGQLARVNDRILLKPAGLGCGQGAAAVGVPHGAARRGSGPHHHHHHHVTN